MDQEARDKLALARSVEMYDVRMGRLLDPVSIVARDLLMSHPNVAGIEDGEDSSNRSKLRLQSPRELVSRSFEIAQLWYDEMLMRSPNEPPNPLEIAEIRGLSKRAEMDVEFGRTEKV